MESKSFFFGGSIEQATPLHSSFIWHDDINLQHGEFKTNMKQVRKEEIWSIVVVHDMLGVLYPTIIYFISFDFVQYV